MARATSRRWCARACVGRGSFAALGDPAALVLVDAATGGRSARCDTLAPERITLASGRSVPVHYDAADAPLDRIAPAGLLRHARGAGHRGRSRVALTVHLLAPERPRRAGDARSRELLDAALPVAAPPALATLSEARLARGRRHRQATTASPTAPVALIRETRTVDPRRRERFRLAQRESAQQKTNSRTPRLRVGATRIPGMLPLVPRREAHEARRARLAARLGNRPALIAAGVPRPRNYAANQYPYRASSHFLYLFGLPLRGAVAIYDGAVFTLYLPDAAPDQALWEGEPPSAEEIATRPRARCSPWRACRERARPRGRDAARAGRRDLSRAKPPARARHSPRRHRRARRAARRRDDRAAPASRRGRARRSCASRRRPPRPRTRPGWRATRPGARPPRCAPRWRRR